MEQQSEVVMQRMLCLCIAQHQNNIYPKPEKTNEFPFLDFLALFGRGQQPKDYSHATEMKVTQSNRINANPEQYRTGQYGTRQPGRSRSKMCNCCLEDLQKDFHCHLNCV